MKLQKTLPALVLTVAMMLSMVTPAWAAGDTGNAEDSAVTGSVQATVRLDYAQTLKEIQERKVKAELFKDTTSLGTVDLTEPQTTALGIYEATVSHRDASGGEAVGSADPKALELTVTDLPQGSYKLRFTGIGYVRCEANFKIDSHSKYVEVGTGDGTFTFGDIFGDDVVNETDRETLSTALGSTQSTDIEKYDLNGDGKIDIIDLAYVNHNVNTPSIHATVLDTTCLDVKFNETESANDLNKAGTKVEGSLGNILQDNSNGVTFKSEGRDTINIPITLSNPVETQSIEIATPNGDGGIGGGKVTVIGKDGDREEVDIPAVPEGVHAIGRAGESSRVIKITLKKRVAVKKITIEVTKTANNEFVTVETIQFLKDIVPENLVEPNSQVRNLYPTAGDAQVALTWNALPNVSGYRVDYWMKDQESNKRQLNVDVNEAIVTGLENGKKYFFTVTPTDGAWIGQTCESVSAEPLSTKAPPAPDMVNVTAQDSALDVSWKKGKEATKFKVYYTDMADTPIGDYKELDRVLTEPSVTISGLTNGTTYYIYVKAGNTSSNGEDRWSAPSRISTGTPKAVSYDKPEGIPTQGILPRDKIASVRLADQGNYHKPAYTADAPFKADNVIDNDYRTHWTASTNWSRDEHIICTFTEPVDLSAAIWVPRLDGTYPTNLRAYSVRVWLDGDDLNGPGRLIVPDPQRGGTDAVGTWPNIPNRSMISTSRFAIMPFGPVENVRQISVAAEQRDYTVVSCSELMFVEYDPGHSLPDEIDALFAGGKDGLHTELASGVSEEKIKALETRLTSEERNYYWDTRTMDDELLMARELLTGGKKTNDMMLNGLQAPAGTESHGQGGSSLQPLGVSARAGQEITVYASGIPEGKSVPIYASQFNAEVSAWNSKIGDVKNGRNIFVVPKIGSQSTERGGSLYYTYNGSDADAAKIQLHVRRAVDIPVLQLADWYKIEDTTKRSRISAYLDELSAYVIAQEITNTNATTRTTNVTEISTPSVLLSIPAKAVLDVNNNSVDKLYDSILAWEDVMHICKTTQGIDETYEKNDMPTRQNIRCMQMFAGAFMYAAGNHIGIGYGSCGNMVSGIPIDKNSPPTDANHLFGWGIAHEIGHNMDKLGKAEITNNIYSLMVQTYDGKNNTLRSRLENSGKYPEIFNKVAQGYPGASNNVFVQLGMYWQLHLAYDGAKNVNGQDKDGPMQFYNRFFTEWKKGNSNTYLQGENITIADLSSDERFALTASGVAGKDLTEFFERWGMTLSGPVKSKLKTYGEETRAIWYLNDQSRRDIIAGKTTQTGTLNVTAEVQADKDNEVKNNVVLTITTSGLNTDANNTISPVQGYEILRDGKSIAFTTDTTYTDIIGSANHRTYTYSVVAYDTCGNKLAEGSAGEVRIAYDKTVPATAYTMTRSGSTVTVQFAEATSISGLKLGGTNCPTSGSYSISIAAEFTNDDKAIETKTVEARNGTFDTGNQAVDDTKSYLTYFQKPGVGNDDTRIWTYDAKTVTITGIPDTVADSDIQLVSYAGDDISFLEGGTMGRLAEDLDCGDGDIIKKDTLVIIGNYRGDPRFNTIQIQGRFTTTNAEGEIAEKTDERAIDGKVYLFAEIPADNEVSDISDGLFIYVPNVQREAELQDKLDEEGNVLTHCSGVNLLPSQIRAVLYRTDDPNNTDNKRTTAETLWINSPGGDDLPTIVLK